MQTTKYRKSSNNRRNSETSPGNRHSLLAKAKENPENNNQSNTPLFLQRSILSEHAKTYYKNSNSVSVQRQPMEKDEEELPAQDAAQQISAKAFTQ